MWSGGRWSEEGLGNILARYKEEVSVIRTQSMELEEEEEIAEEILLKEKSKYTPNGCYFNSIPNS